ncbi:MAG: ABC transporter ATP-binding protein [Syntrophales bacterium]|jgi:peptide/nickel transport system ATP-binding protein/oligopeptide transport system ATP-binding protein|nr:ABC transporter ATP-binding protein [Syntrophales bacterium]
MTEAETILEIRELSSHFETERGIVRAVDEVSLKIGAGQTVAVVGESGCGKTVLALSILRLLPSPPGRIAGGEVLLQGINLLDLSEDEMRKVRGRDISMIFQEPMTSLNPVFPIGEQIAEVFRLHQEMGRREAHMNSVDMLRLVGIPSPEKRVSDYPHQMSGGMRQRVMIAIAMACSPRVMLADEPTTALDVTIQAQIIELILSLQQRTGTSVLLITHDLGVVSEAADFAFVMYAGRIVESAPAKELLISPLHPYTNGLINSLPGRKAALGRDIFLKAIPGMVPPLYDLPSGCRFQGRCAEALPICREEEPLLKEVAPGRSCRCWRH